MNSSGFFSPSSSLLGGHVCTILFYSWGLVKTAGPPSLVILARAMSPCQAYTDGACVLIWPELCFTLSGIIKRDFGGRLLMAAVDAKSFQCHLSEQDTTFRGHVGDCGFATSQRHQISSLDQCRSLTALRSCQKGATGRRSHPHTHLHRELYLLQSQQFGCFEMSILLLTH